MNGHFIRKEFDDVYLVIVEVDFDAVGLVNLRDSINAILLGLTDEAARESE